MELLALNEGLKICEDQNYTPIEINTDSKEVIKILNEGNQLYNGIIDDCKSRLRRLGCPTLTHIYRLQNMKPDALAKHGAANKYFLTNPSTSIFSGVCTTRCVGKHTRNYFCKMY